MHRHIISYVCPADLLSSAWAVTSSNKVGTQGKHGLNPTRILKAVASAHRRRLTLLLPLDLVHHRRTRCSRALQDSVHGLAQLRSLGSLFGSTGLNLLAGGTGLDTGLSTDNSGTSCSSLLSLEVRNISLFLFSLISSCRYNRHLHSNMMHRLLRNQCETSCMDKTNRGSGTEKSGGACESREGGNAKTTRDKSTNDKPPDDNTASQFLRINGRTDTARKRKTVAEANDGNARAGQERDELGEALKNRVKNLEEKFGSGARPYDSQDGTRSTRVKKIAAAWVHRSVSVKKVTQPQEQHEAVYLDADDIVAQRVVKFLALQAGARASSSHDHRKGIHQSPRLSAKSDKSARSDMKRVSPQAASSHSMMMMLLPLLQRSRRHKKGWRHDIDRTSNKAQRRARQVSRMNSYRGLSLMQ